MDKEAAMTDHALSAASILADARRCHTPGANASIAFLRAFILYYYFMFKQTRLIWPALRSSRREHKGDAGMT
jgi:hypothetical protein